jgi:uncharacterized protein (TIGR03546 family)
MIIPKFIRKILAIFRGTVSPVMILLSTTLGLWFGLIPGWSGFHTAIVLLVLVLNIHLALFLLSAALGKAICFAAAPSLFYVGVWLQRNMSGLFNVLAHIPIIGMTDFSRYSVSGALVVGPAYGLVAGLLLARSVIGFRKALLRLEEGSEKFRKWYSNPWVRILDRLLLGKRTKNAKALFAAKTKVFRKAGVALAVIVLVAAIVVTTMLEDDTIKGYAARSMTRANGAEVNLDDFNLNMLGGAVSVSGIQITDAKKPENNQVFVGKITADASLYHLLLGRLVMENVEVSDMKFDQLREKPGSVVQSKTEQKPPVFDPCDFKLEDFDINKLEAYVKDAKALKQWLQKVRKWLPKPKDKDQKQVPQKYLGYLQARADVPPSPRILAKKIVLDKVEIPSQLFGNSKVSLENVSDSARAAKLPVRLRIQSYDTPADVHVTIDYSAQDKEPNVSGTFEGFDLGKMQSGLNSGSALAFESGAASGSFNGRVTNQSIDLTITVTVRDMKATSRGKGALGLDSSTTSEALDVLKNLNTRIRIVGPVTEPRIAFDIEGLQGELKEALLAAGKDKLAQEVGKQIKKQLDGKLPDEVPDQIKDVLDKPEDIIEGLGGLLGGKKDK